MTVTRGRGSKQNNVDTVYGVTGYRVNQDIG